MRALAFVGGWAHPAAQTGPPTRDALASLGIACTVVDSFSEAKAALKHGNVDLFVVHACRFQMLDARYSADQRAAHASLTPLDFRQAVLDHVGGGGPLLVLHTGALCFDDWSGWTTLIGATWSWERSNHPAPGPFEVAPTEDPVVAGIARFEVVDELYRFVAPVESARIVATATDDARIDHPVAWLHDTGPARVAYSSLGHDARSLTNAGHRLLLRAIVDWLVYQ